MTAVARLHHTVPDNPHSIEAEQALLGAILINNEAMSAIRLQMDDFYEPAHGLIFATAQELISAGKLASPVTIRQFLPEGNIAGLTLNQYLARLAAEATTVINAPDYAWIIRDCAQRRAIVAIAERMLVEARAPLGKTLDGASNLAIDSISSLDEIIEHSATTRGIVTMAEAVTTAVDQVATAYQRDGGLSGTPTGLVDLDGLTGGLHGGDLIILAGRPGMGKSAVAVDIGQRLAQGGYGVAEYSLEMSHDALALRALASRASTPERRISYFAMRAGKIDETDFYKIRDEAVNLGKLPYFIDDRASITIGDLSSSVRNVSKRLERAGHPLFLVIVDYLQLMKPGNRYSGSRVNEVTEISGGLKRIARDHGVAVLALSQLSRELEKREDKRPQLSDLRESGAIEQDADTVIFLYREEYYLDQRKPKEADVDRFGEWLSKKERYHNKMEVIVAKQRHGPTGGVEMLFDAGTNTIASLAQPWRT